MNPSILSKSQLNSIREFSSMCRHHIEMANTVFNTIPPVVATTTNCNPVVQAMSTIREMTAQLKEIDVIVGIEEKFLTRKTGVTIAAGATTGALAVAPFCLVDAGASAAVGAVVGALLAARENRVDKNRLEIKTLLPNLLLLLNNLRDLDTIVKKMYGY